MARPALPASGTPRSRVKYQTVTAPTPSMATTETAFSSATFSGKRGASRKASESSAGKPGG